MSKSGNTFSKGVAKVMPLLIVSNTILAGLVLFASAKRDVTQAMQPTNGETGVSQVSTSLQPVLAKAKRIHIGFTHWELLYWSLMRLNPAATYLTAPAAAQVPPGAKVDLHLIPHSAYYAWDAPAPIRGGKLGELRLAGTISSGSDLVFCTGPVCQTECSTCNDFFLLPLKSTKNGTNLELSMTGPVAYLNTAQTGFVKLSYFNATSLATGGSDWIPLAQLAAYKGTFPDQGFDHIQVELSCEAGPNCPLAKTTLALRPGVRYLVDAMPEFKAGVSMDKISELFGSGWEGTEGSGYWKFKWQWRPGTNKMDAAWAGAGGEKLNDVMTVTAITEKEVKILRSTTNSHFIGRWLPGAVPAAKGYAEWDPRDIWEGRRVGPPAKKP